MRPTGLILALVALVVAGVARFELSAGTGVAELAGPPAVAASPTLDPTSATPSVSSPSASSSSPAEPSSGPVVQARGEDVRVTRDDLPESYGRLEGGTDPTMRACSTGRREQNEPTVAVNPRDTDIVVAGSNDYCAGMENGDAWPGYYRSTDGGRTWTASLIPGYPEDDSLLGQVSLAHQRCSGGGDPTQAFDLEGRLFYGFICAEGRGDGGANQEEFASAAYVSTFDEDGARYVRTVLLAEATEDSVHDKINLTVDLTEGIHSGNVYAAWVELSGQHGDEFEEGRVLVARSSTQGRTFSRPMEIDSAGEFPDVAVGPDGAVYVAYRVGRAIYVAKSTDGGRLFDRPSAVTSFSPFDSDQFSGNSERDCGDGSRACPTGWTFTRFQSQAAVTADESGVHVVWNARRGPGQSKVLARTSPDGLDWSDPVVQLDAAADGHQWFPDVASADGVISVVFYDSRRDPAYDPDRPPGNTADGENAGGAVDAFVAQSRDGGGTWSEVRVSREPSNFGFEAPFQVPFWGDYLYVSAVPGAVQVVWTDSRDLVPGEDPLEPGKKGDRDGFDVLDGCRYVPNDINSDGYFEPDVGDACLSQGGYDQNIYTIRL